MSLHFHRSSQTSAPASGRPCGHHSHKGTCSTCQRIQLERWNMQLATARPVRRAG